jgi:membrane-bound lytic murein transglycosylase F
MKRILYIVLITCVIIFITSINPFDVFVHKKFDTDIEQITTRGSLIVSTSKNSSDYFLFKGEPKGFQLEILEDLGNYLGLKVEVLVSEDPSENIENLRTGKCDMIASSWNLSSSISDFAVNSIPLFKTDLVLVQRKECNNRPNSVSRNFVHNLNELMGKTVYVPVMTKQADIMEHFNENFHKQIHVIEIPQYSQEKLVELVADESVEYTICNGILADSYKINYPALDFSTIINSGEPVSWVFRKTSPKLVQKVNSWLSNYENSTRFAMLYDKYFNQQNKWAITVNRYQIIKEGRISAYDDLLKKYSTTINWDWRLLASLIYQESRFNPFVKSYRGAYGLMQMMPSTREYFGIDTTASPEKQIKAGVQYIKFLDKEFSDKIPDPNERINFILASYNIGPGHILDAQYLAGKFGKNPKKWFKNVDTCLLSKSNPKQYNDPFVQFGYCSGLETYNFVREIINRYHHYKNVVAEK